MIDFRSDVAKCKEVSETIDTGHSRSFVFGIQR